MLNLEITRRRGLITLSLDLVNSNFEGVVEYLKDILVMETTIDIKNNSITFCGYSPKFKECEELETAPFYTILFDNDGEPQLVLEELK